MDLRFAGIKRKKQYSPNHQVNDHLILTLTAEALKSKGASVEICEEEAIETAAPDADIIFSMARGPEAINILQNRQDFGNLILNPPQSVLNCYRFNTIRILKRAGIPFPHSRLIPVSFHLNGLLNEFSSPKIWIKRSDVHGMSGEVDVILIDTENSELYKAFRDFRKLGMRSVIVQENIQGDVVKFYSVRGTGFFYWYYTDKLHNTSFEENTLKEIASASAELLDLHIYGGDAIICKDGSVVLIDINDWPSYAPVREEAGQVIAGYLFNQALLFRKQNSGISNNSGLKSVWPKINTRR